MIVQTVGVKQRRTRKSSGRREGSAEREAPGREREGSNAADTGERDRARGAMY